ncbi:MAG: hypothetical protein CMJ59_13585 [Planctomycetaceae bacterium]|nr:hypothetical protein [Planctomycetaceae bacterium]
MCPVISIKTKCVEDLATPTFDAAAVCKAPHPNELHRQTEIAPRQGWRVFAARDQADATHTATDEKRSSSVAQS